ncbi:OmpA family protein [Nonlabens sp.]|uniref:OmpA family protein n=1 Tax=Nonlabens sp. TaxID=1888209 RepID=UPI003F69BA18
MKKIITFSLVLCSLMAVGQEQAAQDQVDATTGYNKWSIDLGAGISKPTRPFSNGAFANTPSLFQGDIGVRYMVNEKFGFNADFGFNSFTNDKNSIEFDTRYFRTTLEGVVNAGHIMGLNKLHDRLGLLLHAGLGASYFKGTDAVLKSEEWMVNLQAGITPQYRLTNNMALFADFSVLGHAMQDITLDGLSRTGTRGFNGLVINASFGLNIYLGKGDTHADWHIFDAEEKIDELMAQMDQMAKEYADDDKDGVPNYLDRDNTTESGVRVDKNGRALDMNKNGIPDDLESALDMRYASKNDLSNFTPGSNGMDGTSQNGVIKKLINEGYVNVYFLYSSTKPALYSLESINTIVTYMNNNPSATATLTGYSDELGTPEFNKNLSERRAKVVYDVLIASGIDASRLSHKGNGEDASVKKESEEARQLVRRVTFKVN